MCTACIAAEAGVCDRPANGFWCAAHAAGSRLSGRDDGRQAQMIASPCASITWWCNLPSTSTQLFNQTNPTLEHQPAGGHHAALPPPPITLQVTAAYYPEKLAMLCGSLCRARWSCLPAKPGCGGCTPSLCFSRSPPGSAASSYVSLGRLRRLGHLRRRAAHRWVAAAAAAATSPAARRHRHPLHPPLPPTPLQ